MHPRRLVWALACLLIAVLGYHSSLSAATTPGWPTYQHDAARSGMDSSQMSFTTPATQWTTAVDGSVYAQPLFVNNQVLVATQNNTVYALDSTTGQVMWTQHLGTPVGAGSLPCGNISQVGITGTPVVDTTNNVLYTVGLFAQPTIHYEVWALNLAQNGAPLYHFVLAPAGFDASIHGQRGALALTQGRWYVSFGGRSGDCGNYHGWVMSANAGDSNGASLVSNPETTASGGGVWSPAGVVADASSNLFIATGNTKGASSYGFGESVLRLSPTDLRIQDSFAPSNWQALDQADADLGSLAPTLLSNLGLVFQAGKNGQGYLLQVNALGGIGGQRYTNPVCSGQEALVATAYDANTSTVYVPCSSSFVAVKVSGGAAPSFSTTNLLSGLSGDPGANTPILAGGAVWEATAAGTLFGFNASTGQQVATLTLPRAPTHFAAPSFGAGSLFIPSDSAVVAVALGPSTAATSTPTPTRVPSNTPTPIPTPTSTPTTAALPSTCPCTIFPSSASPTNTNGNDTNSVEVGVKFRTDVGGLISGVRFYKLGVNTGSHVGSLWTSSGSLLATAMFSNETAAGWQQVTFASPVAVSANTTYVASYHTNGHYAADVNAFSSSGVDNAPLHALSNAAGTGNGVYAYGPSTAFPAQTFNSSNYWVDVVFTTTTATATPTRTPTPTPTMLPGACPCTIFPSSASPSTAGGTDTNSVEVGVKFRADVSGFVSGVRFYKLGVNTGSHVGSLWSSSGSLLATALFANETASGWQQVSFASPVAVSANTIYVASYHTAGHYAVDRNFFSTSGADNPPLHALANAVSGGNGVYMYGSSTAFPSNTFSSSNYWVDVVFTTSTPTRTPTPAPAATPASGQPSLVTFDDISANQPLNGQYPSGQIDWGTNQWFVADPWGAFTTHSISYPSSGPVSGSFTFTTPRRLVSVDAYNGGSGPSTITLTCGSNPTVTQTLAAGQLSTISTNWSSACSGVTLGSSDGWWTNFDNVTYTN